MRDQFEDKFEDILPQAKPEGDEDVSNSWGDLILFFEHFNGDTGAGLGASHQTGWTALVANLVNEVAKAGGGELGMSRVEIDRQEHADTSPDRSQAIPRNS